MLRVVYLRLNVQIEVQGGMRLTDTSWVDLLFIATCPHVVAGTCAQR